MVLILDGICSYAEDKHKACVLSELQLSPLKWVLSDA